MPVTTPPLIPEAFAQSGDRVTIPDTTITPGRASYNLGFPPVTMQPKVAGGIPPDGRDFNGIFYALSAHALFLQGGQVFKYDAAISTAIGGYAIGAIVESTDGSTLWLNLSDSNTSDPDASGTGWVPMNSYGYSYISGLTGGTRTLTRVEQRSDTIVLSGALVANQTVLLTHDLRSWRIVNLTTGSFSTTVSVLGGTGVVVPQGGYAASVGVYGNGTDLFLEVPPVALPIAVTPDPNTLAKRDNVGDLFTRYFNGSSSPEAFTVGNVMATNGLDGYLRKMSMGNFLLQVFADAALTGNPTAPTQALGNNTTRIASTEFVQAAIQADIIGGAGQTWQGVSISNGGTNTNSTGHPLSVRVISSINGTPGGNVNVTVGGINIGGIGVSGAGAVQQVDTFVVPAGATWVVAWSGSVNFISALGLF